MDKLKNIDLNKININDIDLNDKNIIESLKIASLKLPKDIIELPNGKFIFNGYFFDDEKTVLAFLTNKNNKVEFAYLRDSWVIVNGTKHESIEDFKRYVKSGTQILKIINFFRRLVFLKPL